MNTQMRSSIGRSAREERRQLRLPITLRGQIGNSQFGTRAVDLTDISTRGCRVYSPFQWRPGTRLVLTIPSLAPMAVTVRWNTYAEIGLAFDKALHPSVVDHVVAMAKTVTEDGSQGS